jgi:hypothetical protein
LEKSEQTPDIPPHVLGTADFKQTSHFKFLVQIKSNKTRMDKNDLHQPAGQDHHPLDINSLLNPSVEEPPIPDLPPTDHADHSTNNNASLEAPEREPTFSEGVVKSTLSNKFRTAGSNSPMSVESTNSNSTNTAHQFYQAHQGYQAPHETEALTQTKQQDTNMADAPHSPPREDSDVHSVAPDDVILPDDGYYPTSLHVDSEMSDTDSAIGSEVMSSTMSLRSSLYESILENGRSYHKYKEGQYYLPNDDMEQDRLNLQHHLWTLTLDGRLHLAPIENPPRVLDLGTGTGLWALEYAERNPSSMVLGTGKSPIT